MSQRPQQLSGVIGLTLGGPQNPALRPMPGATEPALYSLFSPSHPHDSKEAQLNVTGLPRGACGSGREMKHFRVSELSKRLGCSAWPSPGKGEEQGWPGRRPGHGFPQHVFMQHLGVQGRRVLRLPLQTGFFSSWEGRPRRGPGQPAGLGALGACGFVLSFW